MVSRRFALPTFALFLLLTLAAAPSHAQIQAPAASLPAAAPSDLMPLKKALYPLSGNGLLEVQSSFQIAGSRGGAAFTFRETAHILACRGGLFRAELNQVSVDGVPKPKLLVVSDGKRVWTYCPGQRAYSVVTYQQFLAVDDDTAALGLVVGSFFLGGMHVLVKGFHDTTKENSAALAVIANAGVTLTSKAQSIGGADYVVYRMLFQKQGLSYLFYVNPQTNALKQVDLTGTTGGMQITFQEKLTSLHIPVSLPTSTIFTWTPPHGAKKSATITVDPF